MGRWIQASHPQYIMHLVRFWDNQRYSQQILGRGSPTSLSIMRVVWHCPVFTDCLLLEQGPEALGRQLRHSAVHPAAHPRDRAHPGLVTGFDLPLIQYPRVVTSGDTVVPMRAIARLLRALGTLGEEGTTDDYAVLGAASGPGSEAGVAGADSWQNPERPGRRRRLAVPRAPARGARGRRRRRGRGRERSRARTTVCRGVPRREKTERGEEPTRVQGPQAKDTPGTQEEAGGCASESKGDAHGAFKHTTSSKKHA